MKALLINYRSNKKLAKSIWGDLSTRALRNLKDMTDSHGLSVAAGDLQFLEGRWYVTHAGLLRIAQQRRCTGIKTSVENNLSSSESNRWVFKATVYKGQGSRGFVGY